MNQYYLPNGKCVCYPNNFPVQCQPYQPGIEYIMNPKPIYDDPEYVGSGKLKGKVAIISGGDSGIGRAVAVAFAKEGADVAIVYLCSYERQDALEAKKRVEELGRRCILFEGDLGNENYCIYVANTTFETLGRIDILVNNIAAQVYENGIEDISDFQLEKLFRNNVFSFFFLTKAALKYMKKGASIINTTSVTAYVGQKNLIDYSSTKGALVAFTRSLSYSLLSKGIRVNAVAPGPVWTPLIPSTFPPKDVALFGTEFRAGRAAQPYELAPAYVFLASEKDSSYVTGQTIHVNGGEMVNS